MSIFCKEVFSSRRFMNFLTKTWQKKTEFSETLPHRVVTDNSYLCNKSIM
jgi:hypothetical protein